MAIFIQGTAITTTTPTISVDPPASTAPLPIGKQIFQLVVVDDSGNVSQPATVTVTIADQTAPTAVINAPQVVASGASFTLDGSKSFDLGGGKVVKYIWTYVGPST